MATQSLFVSATSRGRIVRQGDLVCVIVDGGGAMVMATQDFLPARKWAESKPASGNPLTDRGRFLDQIPAMVSRPGSLISTRGSQRQVATLARQMRQAGYDLGEWNLPPELKNPRNPLADLPALAKHGAPAGASQDPEDRSLESGGPEIDPASQA